MMRIKVNKAVTKLKLMLINIISTQIQNPLECFAAKLAKYIVLFVDRNDPEERCRIICIKVFTLCFSILKFSDRLTLIAIITDYNNRQYFSAENFWPE